MNSLSRSRTISPYLAVLVIVIFGSVMAHIISETGHAFLALQTEQEILQAALR